MTARMRIVKFREGKGEKKPMSSMIKAMHGGDVNAKTSIPQREIQRQCSNRNC